MNERKLKVIYAAQQVFEEKGIVSTSVQDILTAAGISKGTFYNYFTSKNECLLAILEMANEESIERRRKLLIGKDRTDKSLFAQQIMTRAHVDRERNLLPIYEAIFFSNDEEMRRYVREQYLYEVAWLSGRLLEIYGPDAEPYATDGAVMLLGVMQHILHIIKIGYGRKDSSHYEQMVPFAIRRLDDMMAGMRKADDILLGNDMLEKLSFADAEKAKEELFRRLRTLLAQFEKSKEQKGVDYVKFLMDELVTGKSGSVILGSVLDAFRNEFAASDSAASVDDIVSRISELGSPAARTPAT
ncbi:MULTISPECIES: TetR/AcrR family transcriptional regulator [Sporosarcina]|uniref:TetR/AcrR family transcriptional regulator n=1 Tax=Sporosarcina TaxID=1569 RepID=UPI00058CB0F0|nr:MULTISPECIES: TetR/AcrR family transcriptional regulator [Sporosarcina]WJY26618.1 TetR/AcrR family transcriptional regulator [Sporosarcina sp. 0.2-SM1T-5]